MEKAAENANRERGLSLMPFALTSCASRRLLLTSPPSPYGIGDMGPAAVAWIERLADAGSWFRAR